MRLQISRTKACLVAPLFVAVLSVVPAADAATITEAGGGSIATAQLIHTPTFNDPTLVRGGVGGDATHIGSGLVTTTGGARQQVSLVGGTPGGQFALTSASAVGINQDGTGRQYSDATFTTEVFFDDDDGPGNYPEFRPGEVTINADGTVHLEFGDFGDNDEITYGYDVIDVTNQTRTNDFFRVEGLQPATAVSAEVLSDAMNHGFTDVALTIFNSAGVALFGPDDSDNSLGGNSFLQVGSTTVPADGVVIIELTQSGSHPIGTYELLVSGRAVPEPSSIALISLAAVALLRRRR